MAEAKIYYPEVGVHNKDLDTSIARLEKSKSYRDLSTIIICPTRGKYLLEWYNHGYL